MRFVPSRIPEVVVIEPKVFEDRRGFVMETWQRAKFLEAGLDPEFVQDNHSSSGRGTLRGLHYQVQQTQAKLVSVAAGEVFDVAVDLRRSSETYGEWVGHRLSAENKSLLWVPQGFAHGFYVTSNSATVLYKCTDFYAPGHSRVIRWDDPTLAIDWPLAEGREPILSNEDQRGSAFLDSEHLQ